MKRAKLAVIFAAALTVLAITAIPASAWYVSLNGGNGGTATAGPAVLQTTTGAPIEVCTKAEGGWVIESTGKQKEQFSNTEPGQKPTKQGPHQTFWISKWNNCSYVGPGGPIPVTVTPCVLQAVQPLKGSGITGVYFSIGTPCEQILVVMPAKGPLVKCEIEIPTEGNEVLKSATVSKTAATETQAYANINNLTTTVSPECAVLGIEGGKAGTFKDSIGAFGETLV
jgi:hypothetical protein